MTLGFRFFVACSSYFAALKRKSAPARSKRLPRSAARCIVILKMIFTSSPFSFTFRYWRTIADAAE
jgi:hypothetical protein